MPKPFCSFTPEIGAEIIRLAAEGIGIKKICESVGIGSVTLHDWRMRYSAFDSELSRALDLGYDIEADSLNEIVDQEADVQRARIKCDNIKWRLARRAAHKYGDRLDVNVNGSLDLTAAIADARNRVQLPGRYPADSIEAEYSEISNALPDSATGFKSVEAESTNADEIESVDIFS